MAANKLIERLATLQLLMPTGVNIASGAALIFGKGAHALPVVAAEAQSTTNPTFDSNTGYLTVDAEGAYNLPVLAETLGTPSAGAAVLPGDALYYAGGTFDPVTQITYGGTICKDTTGDFFGIALMAVPAGTTAVIGVLLRNSC